jgi:hypothetical protein
MNKRPFSYNADAPLERGSGESLRANQALRDYAFMGGGRSLLKLVRQYQSYAKPVPGGSQKLITDPPSRHLQSLKVWSSTYKWAERVDAWDRLQLADEQVLWAERRRQALERNYEAANKMLELYLAGMAEAPKFVRDRQIKLDDEHTLRILALDGQLILKAGVEGVKLLRLATGLETERKAIDHTGLATQPAGNFEGLDDDDLNQLIANILAAAAEGDAGGSAAGEAAPEDASEEPDKD